MSQQSVPDNKKRKKILIVDDEEIIRFTFNDLLTRAGYRVFLTDSCSGAIDLIQSEQFDLLLIDICLGDGDGMDIVRKVHHEEYDAGTVIITGNPDLRTAREAIRYRVYDYLTKPILKEALLRTIEMTLQHKSFKAEQKRYRRNLDAIFRSVDDAIITVDTDHRILELNEAAGRICNLPGNEARGQILDQILPDCSRKCLAALQDTIEKRKPVEINRVQCCTEHEAGSNNRPPKILNLKTVPLIGNNDQHEGAVLILRDITRLVSLESNLDERRQLLCNTSVSITMKKLNCLIGELANLRSTVLIMGESGTGKELVAEALHYRGERGEKPLVKVNCSALSEDLLESELFGHVRGAFTGAHTDKIGRFERADGGTIFLDEIGEISRRLQLKLLRFLQEKELERVGSSSPIRVDVRIIAATNRNLREAIARGEFREDLYYRLKVVELLVPALRERLEDLPLIVGYFIKKYSVQFNKSINSVSREAMGLLADYSWPGNIRELQHTLEYACILCSSSEITVGDLPGDFPPKKELNKEGRNSNDSARPDRLDKESIAQAMIRAVGNKTLAAELLGVSRRTIYRKLKKYGAESDSFD